MRFPPWILYAGPRKGICGGKCYRYDGHRDREEQMAQLHERQTNQSLKCSLFISKDFLMSRSIVVLWSYNVPPVIHMIINKTVFFFPWFQHCGGV